MVLDVSTASGGFFSGGSGGRGCNDWTTVQRCGNERMKNNDRKNSTSNIRGWR